MWVFVYAEQILFQHAAKSFGADSLTGMRLPPAMNQPLEGFHKKYARTASRIENLQVPLSAVPRKYSVENKVHEVWRSIVNALARCPFTDECFVDATDKLQWDGIERILRPKAKLALWHIHVAFDEFPKQSEVLRLDVVPFFSPTACTFLGTIALARKEIAIELIV